MWREGPGVRQAATGPPRRPGMASMHSRIRSSSGTPAKDAHTPRMGGLVVGNGGSSFCRCGCTSGSTASITYFKSATVFAKMPVTRTPPVILGPENGGRMPSPASYPILPLDARSELTPQNAAYRPHSHLHSWPSYKCIEFTTPVSIVSGMRREPFQSFPRANAAIPAATAAAEPPELPPAESCGLYGLQVGP